MAFENFAEILIVDYNMFDRPRTLYNHSTIDDDAQVFKIANRHSHTNCKIKINPAEFVEENS